MLLERKVQSVSMMSMLKSGRGKMKKELPKRKGVRKRELPSRLDPPCIIHTLVDAMCESLLMLDLVIIDHLWR